MLEIICIVDIVMSFAAAAGGAFMRFFTPKDINSLIGYRTARSMKSESAWQLANRTCGKLWLAGGTVLFALSLLTLLAVYPLAGETAALAVSAVLLAACTAGFVCSVIFVEKKLSQLPE